MITRRLPLAVLLTLSVTGCADFGGPINSANPSALSPEERRLQDVETKTAQLSRRLDALTSNGADQELTRLREEVRSLRGDIEKLRFDTDSRERSSKQLYLDLDARLARLETGGTVSITPPLAGASAQPLPGAPGTLSAVAPALASAPAQATVASPEEESAYLSTFDLLKNGKYDEAISGFRGMLERFPQGRYADNAWYWMGEANYVKRDYGKALEAFQSLVDKFPQSAKLPDALLKVGLSNLELKRDVQGKAALQRVVREFPNANAANLARQRLQLIGG
ncbi:MAG TPA: tol-pal system protein YbgF [Nevskiaceae bacterium]|nr:tol-pal system protein YbgF [Nevskiaceae bacterium]